MNILIGTDIIEVNRIKKAVQNERFLKRIFTQHEIEYCESKKMQKYQSYAGKFSAKEAIFKALSGIVKEYKWTDFEILNDKKGKPYVKLNINIDGIKNIEISISHCKAYATAYAIVVF